VPGLNKNLLFFDHRIPEDSGEFNSKQNEHETTFILALTMYLIQNGIKGDDIAILAPYKGQIFLLLQKRKENLNSCVDIQKNYKRS